ncbi:MAG: hypothetical protein FIB08_12250 [Candidatus Methanoperedens sp.]|nr:hypothetical protein [Candidatus Methanoperedens sp.]
MRIKIRKGIHMLKILFILSTVISLTLVQAAIAGIVVPGVTTNPCDGKRFMGFEEPLWKDKDPIASTIPGLQFTTTDGYDWIIGDFATGLYNGKFPPRGRYTSDGTKWAWLGSGQSQGRIDFTYGTAAYFSLLTSTESGLILEALDENNNVLDSATAAPNPRTGWLTRLTVNVSSPQISYIKVHDTGNFFLLDDICTDAPAEPETSIPEFPSIAVPIISAVGLMILIQRKKPR